MDSTKVSLLTDLETAGHGVLTADSFNTAVLTIASRSNISHGWYITVGAPMAREVDWYLHRPLLRSIYSKAGYPFGRNQGSFKRWALLVGRYPSGDPLVRKLPRLRDEPHDTRGNWNAY